jgi:hypothetical protein
MDGDLRRRIEEQKMENPKAVGVLHIESEFLVLFLVQAEGPRETQTYVAVNEDAPSFLTCPDFRKWNIDDGFRLLRTGNLSADQKSALRTAFIEQQVSMLKQAFNPLEIAINKTVADRTLFSLFGQGWGLGWKAKARTLIEVYPATSGPARYLRLNSPAVETAYLGTLYLAVKHGFTPRLSHAEREAEALRQLLGPERGTRIYP